MNRKLLVLLGTIVLVLMGIAPAMADGLNQKIFLTVKNGNLLLPGRALGPGKYDLKFADDEHKFVDFSTADGNHIGFYQVVPISRAVRNDNVDLVVADQKPSVAELKAFFYPDTKTGYEFLYPAPRADRAANAGNNPPHPE